MDEADLVIEVACATPARQVVTEIKVSAGTTVAGAIRLSNIAAEFPELDIDSCKVGIYGELVSSDRKVVTGDRVEIYRELMLDPRQARFRRVSAARDQEPKNGK